MKFTFIFLFLFGVSLICLVEGNHPNPPALPEEDEFDDEELDEEEEDEEEAEEDEYGEEEEEEEYAGDEYELEEAAEDYYDDEIVTEPPTTLPPTTTSTATTTKPTTTSTTTKPTTTTTTTKPATTTTKSTTTTTVDARKALELKIIVLLNSFSALQTAVNSATVQDKACKEKISSSLVAYLASGLQLETNLYSEPYSKNLNILTKLESELSDVKKEWNECQARTTTTTTETPTTTSTTTTTEKTTTTTTEKPTTTSTTTTTEKPTTTTTECTTTTEEIRLKESIPEFTIDPPKQDYAREPNSAQDDEIQKALMEEIMRTEDMIEKQKKSIIIPTAIEPIIEENVDEPIPTTTKTTTTTKKPTTKKVVITTTTAPHLNKHMLRPKFKGLKATKDKPPAICSESMDLYHSGRYAKSVCVVNKNVSYDDAQEICSKDEMDLFAIQTVDHHLVCRHQLHHLFKNVPSYWINGRYINDLWYYFLSENKGQKRFIYPGTQFDGAHSGSCLRLMRFTGHHPIAANAADCDLEIPLLCEYYIAQ